MPVDQRSPVQTVEPPRPKRRRTLRKQRQTGTTQVLPTAHRRRWNRVAGPVAAFLGLAMLLSIGYLAVQVHQINETKDADDAIRAEQANQLDASSPPSGPAELCLTLWLSAGTDTTGTLDTACDPGTIPVAQTSNAVQVDARALPAPNTRLVDTNYWSVMVQARAVERVLDADGNATLTDAGTSYWRVAIYVNPDTGASTMRGAPRPVAAPSGASAPDITATWTAAQTDDPRTELLSNYLTAYLIDGSVSNYLDPSLPSITVHDPTYALVDVTATSYRPTEDPATFEAEVRATITTVNGNTIAAEFPFTITQATSDLWRITGQPTAPILEGTPR